MFKSKDKDTKQNESFFSKLDPSTRKWVYGATAAVAVIASCYALTSDVKPKDKNNEIKNILTDKKTDDLGLESLLAQIKISNDNFCIE